MSEILYTSAKPSTASVTLESILAAKNELLAKFGKAMPSIQIIQSEYCGRRSEQYRFPKSKKKRIRRKFAKKYWRYVWDEVAYQIPTFFGNGYSLLCSPTFYKKIKDLK